ncbi:acyl-CoA dehydrogenase family protein [Hasllibacter sp. MH4015]|uniref:acyl-CoA dehydrogenase family protein n=1 Tax=Hasllibacter sp. MH4015 TaxID=2854029 RepID=UPI001CD78AAA|nr:acyl-CoA dehydrogenase [Hasllibacter sp. MH4015]
MNFEMSDDRRMLSDTLTRFLAEHCPVERRVDVAYDAPWHAPAAWDGLVELGTLYALADEGAGGMGGSGFDIAVVFEALGRALCPEPVLPALLAIRLLAAAGQDLDPLLTGTKYAIGIGELDAPYDLDGIKTQAVERDGTWHLTGRKSVVYGSAVADRLLIVARMGDALAVFAVDAPQAEVTPFGMIDGGPAGEVFLDETPATLVLRDARAAVEDAMEAGALALSAEALGAMEATMAALTDYLGTRKQFGQPLGAFQALQHRAIDLMIEVEQARSSVILAADALNGPDQSHRTSQAKHLVGKIARQVSEEAIQMHGGIGITWEYPVAHYAKRLVMIDHQLGDTDWHLERLMARLADA